MSKERDKNAEISEGKATTTTVICITAAFLAALMWRRPLNSVFNHYYFQKIKKAAKGDRNLSAMLDDKQVDGGIE